MKNLVSRIISIILVLALFCTFLPLSAFADYYPSVDGSYYSLVDALKSIGVDSSFSFRERIANENGVYDYRGTGEQNLYLLDCLLKQGQLVIPGTSISTSDEEYETPAYEDAWSYETYDYSDPEPPAIFLGYASPSQEMVEAVECTTLRTEPRKVSTAICSIVPGDCFTLDGPPVTNEYGNLWYAVRYAGTTAYIYSERVEWHSHYYTRIGASDVSICKCGACSTADNYASTINAGAVALDPSIFGDPEALTAAVAVLSATGSAIVAAAPYAVLVVAAGTLIYLVVTSSGAQVLESYELKTAEDCESRLQEDGAGVYYKAATVKGSGALLLAVGESDKMDISEANRFLKIVVDGQAATAAVMSDLTRSVGASVWTYSLQDATDLCERFDNLGSRYGYGSSTAYDCYYEANSRNGRYIAGYYRHFHLYYQPFFSSWLKKSDDSHVFFGLPTVGGETY